MFLWLLWTGTGFPHRLCGLDGFYGVPYASSTAIPGEPETSGRDRFTLWIASCRIDSIPCTRVLGTMDEIKDIFQRITEHYDVPVRVGSRCEANIYYRVEDLKPDDIASCGEYVAERIVKVCSPTLPSIIIALRGSYTGLAIELSTRLAPPGEALEVLTYEQVNGGNGYGSQIKGANVILVNDVITTARSCLEAHTRVTMMGASILCWAALIDRTFGPGPVPVVAAFTGAPITLLEGLP